MGFLPGLLINKCINPIRGKPAKTMKTKIEEEVRKNREKLEKAETFEEFQRMKFKIKRKNSK